ncbi:MAG: formate C-acetyltransferase/glycerol dehydratase family glycyl radical enzyme, partial [Armatimonadetes bacterium CG_4_9_14_3_um_filter_58_7]
IDSIIAIRKCVFQDGSVRAQELMAALSTNFEGAEPLRQQLLDAPKFGNDSDYVDVLASDVIDHAWRTLYSHEPPRGGRYLASCILFATYGGAGKIVGATPDGRKAYEPLTDSVGAMQGCDTNGPTALLNSVTRLPLHLGAGTPILNIRLLKKTMESDQELRALVHMIRAYFSNGGLQLQISVISKEEMLAAQKEPEKHRDLIVRIGGYSEYF